MKYLLLVLTLLTAKAFAGDASTFTNLGFSKFGFYYAFMQSGRQDGSGFPYADVAVIKVGTNTMVARKKVTIEDESQPVGLASVKAIEGIHLDQYGIESGKITGRTLLARSATDLSTYSDTKFTTRYYPGIESPVYELKIQPTDLDPATCFGEHTPQLLKLALTGLPGGAVVLQNDQALPASRFCAHNYKIERVIQSVDALVVIVRYDSKGFEGPDQRVIAVTGRILFP